MILEKTVGYLIDDDEYRCHLAYLRKEFPKLRRWSVELPKNFTPNNDILESTRLVINASIEADCIYNQAIMDKSFNKQASFISKIIIKTLKIAEKALALLIFQNPLKVGFAYSALHQVIKFFEKQLKKNVVK